MNVNQRRENAGRLVSQLTVRCMARCTRPPRACRAGSRRRSVMARARPAFRQWSLAAKPGGNTSPIGRSNRCPTFRDARCPARSLPARAPFPPAVSRSARIRCDWPLSWSPSQTGILSLPSAAEPLSLPQFLASGYCKLIQECVRFQASSAFRRPADRWCNRGITWKRVGRTALGSATGDGFEELS